MNPYEKEAVSTGFRFILGIDEAGRGPLAGPVVAAAVHLNSFDFPSSCKINDSKRLTPKAREQAFHQIYEQGYVGIGIVSEVVIDEINILNATFMAMDIAVRQLLRSIPAEAGLDGSAGQVMLLVDGNHFRTDLPYPYKTIIDGDALCTSIACASIIAKVYRDRVMGHYDQVFPQYGFNDHKGYSTERHRKALKMHGPSRIHRKSFEWSGQ